MKREPAFTVREGSSSVRAYKYGTGPNKSARFCIYWYRFPGDKPQRQTKKGERAARDRAGEIARDLANDRSLTVELTGPDRETHLRIKAMAAELSIPIFDLVEQAFAAKKRLGTSSLIEAVDGFMQNRTRRGSAATVPEIFLQFIRGKQTALRNGDLSDVHVKNLREDLEKFCLHFVGPIADVRTDQLQDWLNERRDKKKMPVGPRRRRHIRDRIVALFNFARDAEYLPPGVKTAAEKTSRPKIIKGIEPTYEPDEFDLLINGAHRDHRQCRLVPCFAIGAFVGMRPSEVARLDWRAVHMDHAEIDVSPKVAGKTGEARIIKMPPNLVEWLKPYVRESGPVLDPSIPRVDNHVRRFAQKIGLKWKRNILRGSCASYLFALTNDMKHVSAQLGNSVRVLRREYIERKTPEKAAQWFAIRPQHTDNVLELRWSVRG
jgi:integrase